MVADRRIYEDSSASIAKGENAFISRELSNFVEFSIDSNFIGSFNDRDQFASHSSGVVQRR